MLKSVQGNTAGDAPQSPWKTGTAIEPQRKKKHSLPRTQYKILLWRYPGRGYVMAEKVGTVCGSSFVVSSTTHRVSVGPTAGRFGPSRSSRRAHAHQCCADARTHSHWHTNTHTNVFLFHYLHFVYKNNVSLIPRLNASIAFPCLVLNVYCILVSTSQNILFRLPTGSAIAGPVDRGTGGRRTAGFRRFLGRRNGVVRRSSLQHASPHHMFHALNAVA